MASYVRRVLGCFLAAFSFSVVAHAAPVATLSCNGPSNTVKVNLSYYTVGVTGPTQAGQGSGAGRATLQPLVVRTSLVNYEAFEKLALNGAHFDSCEMESKLPSGTTVLFDLKLLQVRSVTAVSEAPRYTNYAPAHYAEVELAYQSVQVRNSGGFDDGGSSGGCGWNCTKAPEPLAGVN